MSPAVATRPFALPALASRSPTPPLAARALYRFLQLCALPTLVFGFRLRIYGRRNLPRSGGAIVASNHQSYIDPVLFGGALPRPIDYFARRSLFRGAFGAFITALNAFPVERGRDVAALRGAMERLRAGHVLLLFPEGTRTETGAMRALEPGVAALARRAGVPVVPAAVAGAFEAWPRGRPLFRIGMPCAVALGRPIPPDAPDLLPRLEREIAAQKRVIERCWTHLGRAPWAPAAMLHEGSPGRSSHAMREPSRRP